MHNEQLLAQAFELQQAGRLAEAERLYQRILRSEPRHPEANHNVGRIALEGGRGAEALSYLKLALEADPSVAHAWLSYVDALLWVKQPLAARQVLDQGQRRGLRGPDVEALQKRLAEVEAQRAKSQPARDKDDANWPDPDAPLPPGAAVSPPDDMIGRLNALNDGEHAAELESALRSMLAQFPRFAPGWTMLGSVLLARRSFASAVEALTNAVRLAPGEAGARVALATALRDSGQTEQAEAQFRHVLRIDPRNVDAHSHLALLLQGFYRLAESEHHLREALRLDQQSARIHSNLGRALQAMGQPAEADKFYRRAVELQPGSLLLHSTRLLNLAYVPGIAPEECLAQARDYGRQAGAGVAARYAQWLSAPAPARLRVGLVSGDLREHPVGYFLDGLLPHLDDARLELFVYSTNHAEDDLTERLRRRCAAWKPLYGHSDAAAAKMIHADGVHLLLDLSGHTAHSRLPVFACRPAPVQATWLGYFATTGLAEIDYLLADPVSVPPEHRGHFTETIWSLPDARMCFTPPNDAPEVTPLPALANGFVTFGSFQNLAKLNDLVLDLWARVLAALPAARLRVQSAALADASVRRHLLQRLEQRSIDADRISLLGDAPRPVYLAAHGEVDLILDTFPFPGGTTTCEALFMGVPTVTLAGDRLIGRQGASLLSAAGLADWVAHSPQQFVQIAVARANDLPALAALRASLRDRVLASPLFDAPRFARNLEDALWGMWQQAPRRM
jgi:predicted O-linked N-acetylglucosamine transferase (SPINDLY family)